MATWQLDQFLKRMHATAWGQASETKPTLAGIGPGGWDANALANAQGQTVETERRARRNEPHERTTAELRYATYVLADYFIIRGDSAGLARVHALRTEVGV